MSLSKPNQNVDVVETAEEVKAVNVTPSQELAPATTQNTAVATHSDEDTFGPRNLMDAEGFFARENFELEPGMSVGCAVISGKIKMGEEMEGDAGEWIDLRVLNFEHHTKVNLGLSDVPKDKAILQLNCYDGKTVRVPSGEEGVDPIDTPVDEYLDSLRGTYPDVKMVPRIRIHGVLLGAEKEDRLLSTANIKPTDFSDPDHEVQLVTIYGSQSIANQFNTHLKKVRMNPRSATLDLRCSLIELKNTKNGRTWNAIKFERRPSQG